MGWREEVIPYGSNLCFLSSAEHLIPIVLRFTNVFVKDLSDANPVTIRIHLNLETDMKRREFLACSSSCAAWMLGIAKFSPNGLRSVMQQIDPKREVVIEEKWGRVEKIEEGVWALVSTPFESRNFTTVCNGGIIAGDKGVVAVESFMQPKGAKWWGEVAEKLTGRWPTDVVSTHYHADHTGGHTGYFTDKHKPQVWLTDATKTAAEKSFDERGMDKNDFQNVMSIDANNGTEIDLGNRKVAIKPRSGHTSSDVTIELTDPSVVWCGDLFFNRMFPNYGDAIPGRLNEYAWTIKQQDDTVFVPGHGPIADSNAAAIYSDFLTWIETWARDSIKAGQSVEVATKDFKLPDEFKDWLVWAPDNAKKAWVAWERELKAAEGSS